MNKQKFKVWHRTSKEWLVQSYQGECFTWLSHGWPIEILDFTGFTDKNGVDIYVGDTVNAYNSSLEDHTTSTVSFYEGAYTLGVYWKDGCHDWYSMEQYVGSELEVVCNKYDEET